jgi:hypothetical protein
MGYLIKLLGSMEIGREIDDVLCVYARIPERQKFGIEKKILKHRADCTLGLRKVEPKVLEKIEYNTRLERSGFAQKKKPADILRTGGSGILNVAGRPDLRRRRCFSTSKYFYLLLYHDSFLSESLPSSMVSSSHS